MKKQTWRQWAIIAGRDPSSPSKLEKGSLAALTGQDSRALDAIVACYELYACGDAAGQQAAVSAVRALLRGMQESMRWIAKELIPFALDWDDRDRLWPLFDVSDVDVPDVLSLLSMCPNCSAVMSWGTPEKPSCPFCDGGVEG